MYLIYMGLCLVAWVAVYFLIPETRGRPVEEMGELFGDEVVMQLTSDGHVLVEKPDGVALDHIEVVEVKGSA